MCLGRTPPSPAPPPPPPEIPKPPTPADPAVARARQTSRQRAALAQGREGTIATTALGLQTQASVAKKKVLGA